MRTQTNDTLFERYFRVQFVNTTIVKNRRKLEELRTFKHFVYRYLGPLPVSRFPLVPGTIKGELIALLVPRKVLFIYL